MNHNTISQKKKNKNTRVKQRSFFFPFLYLRIEKYQRWLIRKESIDMALTLLYSSISSFILLQSPLVLRFTCTHVIFTSQKNFF